MFDYDKWQEILLTIKHNKLRTVLTIFSLTWGMFMIILLSGLAESFRGGVVKSFSGWASNSGFMWGMVTTISEGGFQPGRRVRFDSFDTNSLLSQVKEIKHLAPRINRSSQVNNTQNPKLFVTNAEVNGDYPDFIKILKQQFIFGRYINDKDMKDERKVAVINERAYQLLFDPEENPLGQYIQIQGVNFIVIGVNKPMNERGDGNSKQAELTIPFSVFSKVFHTEGKVAFYSFSIDDRVNMDSVMTKMKTILKRNKKVSPQDEEAIGSFNLGEEIKEVLGIFKGMKVFTLFIGIAILVASILGISNIMLIIVKERTKEIGIRKSLGASGYSIVSLIIQESIFLTTVGGLIGIIGAFLLIDVLNIFIISNLGDDLPFGVIQVSNRLIFIILSILVVGGSLAGIWPAIKAIKIRPVEAMGSEG